MEANALSCTDLIKTFDQDGHAINVLRGVSLCISTGERVAIMGQSGSGKSTLLHCLGLLEPPTSGSITCLGQAAAGLSDQAMAAIRCRQIGFVFQAFYLVPGLTVRENVLLPLLIGRAGGDRTARVDELLRRVGLAHRCNHRPAQLSGGEQQRVALARALVTQPDLLLLDEPTGNLDSQTGQDILRLIVELQQSTGLTAVMVTHDPAAAAYCSRIITIRDGRIIEPNTPAAASRCREEGSL
jgi:putative ABC transport system ATP-binding protein